ncbi:hypothetical protein G6F46_012504 [Rhizopus delemar]|uniref:Uncharacterized protein n=2 Tax=Rhizopus TaxID=4842 RepID=A0A9P6YQY7_9FUNG|nr:hypothetical protein G6F36_013867 [Rhizopus arrhizus]KAG1444418.1 hypothetical protein G6F55_012330 [Rhizopus delemar]KAG1487931.1 hypothetical protein G6F54_012363 [Rhizopus delemar]KAG1494947.1 hypothetical protein G6F53_012474 [Rhizopus delemar]KAG1527473.1 hypothetical protein G6F52_001506 [Rhizopus delemar]
MFLFEEFIKDKFQSLKEDYRLDLYWNDTLTETLAVKTHKRMLDNAIAALSSPSTSKRRITDQDKNMRNLLTKNAIFDFSNEGDTSQVALLDDWEDLKTKYRQEYDVPSISAPIKDAVNGVFIKVFINY